MSCRYLVQMQKSIAKGTEGKASGKIRNFEALQVNMACPMPKVTKKAGSKLMEHPKASAEIIKAMKRAGLPTWAKIRIMPREAV